MALKDILNQFTQDVKEVAKNVTDKANDTIEITKLSAKISSEEAQVATYLKDFKVKLPANVANAPSTKFNVILNKGTLYKFTVCNADGYEGKAIIKLSEGPNTLGTNLKPDGSFQDAVGFQCQKTGMYILSCGFKNGKEGAAVIIMSYMNK